ncbi:MAG: CrcB family protein [Candidatus Protistobacter heckmanni]|nr:CrcB family protein [Candidatus Protistobacter heckmanni]
MNVLGFLGVVTGAMLGAWLRWAFGVGMAGASATMPGGLPLGTLASNLLGGLLIGCAIAYFAGHPDLNPAWRLFAVTGFLGGLTTFSFESLGYLLDGRYMLAVGHSSVHLFGSLLTCALGHALTEKLA